MKYNFTLITFMLLFFVLSLNTSAQTKTIQGTVQDQQTLETLPGIAVVVKNTSIGVFTDEDGVFSISVPDSITTLFFQGIGYEPLVVRISDSMVVGLVQDKMMLNEVVVTANAIAREKRSLGYATQEVTSLELVKGQNTSALSALQGKVAGLNVTTTTGAPGGSTRFVLRGGTSLTGNNQALIVVDGIPIDNSSFSNEDATGRRDDLNNQVDYANRANDVNPNDIESINVLKGPAAAALYGSRASNGAIVITTKGGVKSEVNKKMEVSYAGNVTFSNVLRYPKFQNEYGQGDAYPGRNPSDRRENFSWGLPFDGNYKPWGQIIDGQQQVKPYSALPDNLKDFFQTGVTNNQYIGISGGTTKSSFHLSLGGLWSKGIVETTKTDKYNIRLKGTTELSNHLEASYSANYSNLYSELPTGGQGDQSLFRNLIQTPRDIPITAGKDLSNPFNSYNDITGKYGYYGAYIINPYFSLKNFRNTNKVDRIQGNVTLSYKKFKYFSVVNRLGGDVYADRRYQFWKKYDYEPIDPFWTGNPKTYQGKYSENIYNLMDIVNDLMINFQKEIGKSFKVYGVLGHNVRIRSQNENHAQTNDQGGLAIADYYNLKNSNGPAQVSSALYQRRLVGVYADLNLSFKNLLFLGVTGRNDWSSTLPKGNNSYFYPSINAAFVFTDLLKDGTNINKYVSYGKLRASAAKVGNDASPYLTTTVFTKTTIDGGFGSTTLPFGSVNGYTRDDVLRNPNLKPEITTAYEVGFELYFLKNRLGLDFSYYSNSSKNQIINAPISNATGYTSKTINTGEIQNKGVELMLRATPILTASGFRVDLFGTYTRNANKVVSIQGGVDQIVLGGASSMGVVAAQGMSYGQFYGTDLRTDGQGHVVVDSSTGLPLTTINPQYLGSYLPKYTASWGATISYKGLSFNILFDTKQGGKFYSYTKSTMAFVGTSQETTEGGRGDRVWANSVYENSEGQYVTNTDRTYNVEEYYTNIIPEGRNVLDASYIKLREMSLSYSLPVGILKRTPFGSANVGVFGNNLFLWTPKQNVYSDPEMNSSGASNIQGFEYAATPSQRNYGFNVKLTF